jgi:hypothetical protein
MTVEQVPLALERWQTSVQAYLDAGGDPLTDDRRKGSVIKLLPWKVQQKVLWDFDDFKCADELIAWIKTKIRLETSMAPKGANAAAHTVEELDEEGQEELANLDGDASNEEINAVFRRGQHRQAQRRNMPAGPWPKRAAGDGKVRAPARPEADSTCPNCIGKGHTGANCTKPKIELTERKCCLCKLPGHSARHCPTMKNKALNNVEAANGKRAPLAMMDCDGFVPIQRQRIIIITPSQRPIRSQPANSIVVKKERPMPRKPVLADYICSNTFAALEATGEAEQELPRTETRISRAEAKSETITTLCSTRGQPASSTSTKKDHHDHNPDAAVTTTTQPSQQRRSRHDHDAAVTTTTRPSRPRPRRRRHDYDAAATTTTQPS